MTLPGRPFLQDMWYAAALSEEIADQPFARTICEEEVVFFRTAAGKAVALEDRCAHRHAPLSLGTVTGDTIQCGYHGLVFGPDGVCRQVPGQDQVPPQACVRAYPVAERDGWVWLWIGDAAKAERLLGWQPRVSFAELVAEMVAADRARLAEANSLTRSNV